MVPHLVACRLCWELAAQIVAELKKDNALARTPDARSAVLTLLEEEEKAALGLLRARAWWADLKTLSRDEQIDRIQAVAALRTQTFCEVILAEARAVAPSDPFVGEEIALVARSLAQSLSTPRYPEKLKSDLQAEAMIAVANCRRLAADWKGSQGALAAASNLLDRGTGDPARQGRFLSICASLATDTGNFEMALGLLGRAAELYRSAQDSGGLSNVSVKEAGTLMAAFRHEEAITRAKEVLAMLAPAEIRLEMLARSIITQSLIYLDRPSEALRSFIAARPLYEQIWGRRTQLDVAYLEALLLDSLGCARESEKAFRDVIAGYIEEELYKDAFLTILTFFESLYKRGALDKAAQVCEDASRLLDTPLCHDQMKQVWAELLEQVRSRALTVGRVLQVRLYLLRHWSVPAARLPLAEVSVPLVLEATAPEPISLPSQPAPVAPEPPEPPPSLANGGYEAARERYDRQLIAAALEECGGRIRETSRLLGISRNTLRTKMGKYGL